ncbi:hypothetical protein EVAR_90396_1 [Eumeta japonica]|uniref:Uncharacterized protein n=1 Tax=Eumeta variegata TaxID=151549 RepID=A0A4C1ZU24_EUMVA|nr:hypothetical protein EVAR_90396_1 [Eumeta japonica]
MMMCLVPWALPCFRHGNNLPPSVAVEKYLGRTIGFYIIILCLYIFVKLQTTVPRAEIEVPVGREMPSHRSACGGRPRPARARRRERQPRSPTRVL